MDGILLQSQKVLLQKNKNGNAPMGTFTKELLRADLMGKVALIALSKKFLQALMI
jgi:hypothetical protein